MATSSKNQTEDFVKKVAIATAASVAGGIIGSIFLPGVGSVLGAKIGAVIGGSNAN